MTADEAATYHSLQANAFAVSGAQMLSALTMNYAAEATGGAAAYFMVNCAHLTHFRPVLGTARGSKA